MRYFYRQHKRYVPCVSIIHTDMVMARACRVCYEEVCSAMPSRAMLWLLPCPFMEVEFCHTQMNCITLAKGVFRL
jgi:hypothetical protein